MGRSLESNWNAASFMQPGVQASTLNPQHSTLNPQP